MKSSSLIIFAALSYASQVNASEVTIADAWARATAPGQENGSVGLVITSQKTARLVAVSSTASADAELHNMTMDNGVMKMRQIEELALPARKAVKLGPGGEHLMLVGLKKPLKAGDFVPLTLTVVFADKRSEKIKVQARVKSLTGGNEHDDHH